MLSPMVRVFISTFTVIFFSSLAESCLLSITNSDIARISGKHPSIGSIWKKFKHESHRPLTLILIFNTSALIIGAATIGASIHRLYGHGWMMILSAVLSYVVLQWGVVFPRTLGFRFRKIVAVIAAYPLLYLTILCGPLVFIVVSVNRPFQKKRSSSTTTAEDIAVLAQSAALEQQISREQAFLIARTVELSKIKASDIMVDISEMNVLSDTMSLNDALVAAHIHNHTRFPLASKGDMNNIKGYVNFKDIVGALRTNPSNPTLKGIRRPLANVSESTPLSDLLRRFTRGYQHIAIVKDQQGKTTGMVTLEDLIETLVGELEDEYDKPPDLIVQISENRFRAGGGATFEQLRARIDSELPAWDLTIDEWIQGQCAGKIPENYATVFQNTSFRVRRVSRGAVYDVIVERSAVTNLHGEVK